MALTGTSRGTGTDNVSATTFTLSPSGNFAAGSWACLSVASDNSHSGGTAFTTFTVTDSLGNTWGRRVSALIDPGVADAGQEGGMFLTPMDGGTLTTATVITVTFDTASTAQTWTLDEIIPAAGKGVAFITSGTGTSGTGTTSPTITTSSITSGDMVIAALFLEAGTTEVITADADSTNGAWSTQQTNKIGTTTSGSNIASQRKIVTGTATQTYNPTLSILGDLCLGWVQLREITPVPVLRDLFNRADQSNFGTPDIGPTWGTLAASSILSNKGRMTVGAGGTGNLWFPQTSVSLLNVDAKVMFRCSNTTNFDAELMVRVEERTVGTVNSMVYAALVTPSTSTWEVAQRLNGTDTLIGSTFVKTLTAATDYWIRLQVFGTTARVKVWADSVGEPAAWDASGTTTVLVEGGVGFLTFATTAVNIDWDNLVAGYIDINSVIPYRNPMPPLIAQ